MYLSRVLLAIWVLGLLGVALELVLLEHYEDWRQVIPFVVIGAGVGVGVWIGLRHSSRARRALQLLIGLLAASGIAGLALHYIGNAEFEREREPGIGGLRLVWESLTGATPALAPGTMLLFAFIGYALLVSQDPGRS
jgi:hypothetical protein